MSTYGSRMFIIQCDAAQLPGVDSEVMDRATKPWQGSWTFREREIAHALILSHGPCSVKPGEKVFARNPASPTARKEPFRSATR